jgi:hypothetical protein
MMNGNTPAPVFVSRMPLQSEGAPLGHGQYIARLQAFRDVYEAVARTKFESGQFKASMKIELSDIAQYPGGRQSCPKSPQTPFG